MSSFRERAEGKVTMKKGGDMATETKQPEKRLCSEIQLFDLCERDVCSARDERYCTDTAMLARFEAIAEDDRSHEQYLAEELDDVEGAGDMGYDDAFGVDEFEDEGEEDEP
jgi:hypothetical protein